MKIVVLSGTQCTEASVTTLSDALSTHLAAPAVTARVTGSCLDEATDHIASLGDELLLVGHSLGGTVALATARRHPDAVVGLALVATNPAGPREDQLRAWDQHEQLARRDGPQAVATQLLPLLLGDDDGSPAWSERSSAVLHMADDTGLDGFIDQLHVQRSRVDELPDLAQATIPVLAISAASDRLVPPTAGNMIATTAPRGTHHTVPGSHMVVMEQPQQLADIIAEWWGDCTAAPHLTTDFHIPQTARSSQ